MQKHSGGDIDRRRGDVSDDRRRFPVCIQDKCVVGTSLIQILTDMGAAFRLEMLETLDNSYLLNFKSIYVYRYMVH